MDVELKDLTAWLLVWDGSGLRCYLANFFFEKMVGVEEVALNPIGTRALTFIPRILQTGNQPHSLRFFGHPIPLPHLTIWLRLLLSVLVLVWLPFWYVMGFLADLG